MESLPADEADRILADLAELMMRVKNPVLRRILADAADAIEEMLPPEPEEEEARQAA
jgi:hypothetical protein